MRKRPRRIAKKHAKALLLNILKRMHPDIKRVDKRYIIKLWSKVWTENYHNKELWR